MLLLDPVFAQLSAKALNFYRNEAEKYPDSQRILSERNSYRKQFLMLTYGSIHIGGFPGRFFQHVPDRISTQIPEMNW